LIVSFSINRLLNYLNLDYLLQIT